MANLLAVPIASRLLYIGGGTGRVSRALRELFRQVIVVDPSAAMLRRAALKPGLEPVLARAERLPFADDAFERVLMVDSFHHFGDQPRALGELWRALMPAGRIVIEEPNINRLPVKIAALAEKLALMHSHFYSAEAIKDMIVRLGAVSAIYQDGSSARIIADK